MNKLEMTPEQQLAFDGLIDVMVQIYKMTSDKMIIQSLKRVKTKRKMAMVQRIRRRLEGFRQFHFWERNRLKIWANTAIMKTLGHNT